MGFLLDHVRLPQVVIVTVHLVKGIILGHFYQRHFFVRALLHG